MKLTKFEKECLTIILKEWLENAETNTDGGDATAELRAIKIVSQILKKLGA